MKEKDLSEFTRLLIALQDPIKSMAIEDALKRALVPLQGFERREYRLPFQIPSLTETSVH